MLARPSDRRRGDSGRLSHSDPGHGNREGPGARSNWRHAHKSPGPACEWRGPRPGLLAMSEVAMSAWLGLAQSWHAWLEKRPRWGWTAQPPCQPRLRARRLGLRSTERREGDDYLAAPPR